MKPKHGILMMKWCFVALCILTILSVGSISQAATIFGNVTDSNGPTQFVNVYLWVVDGSPSPLPGTCTDVNGNYELSGITAGKYILAAGVRIVIWTRIMPKLSIRKIHLDILLGLTISKRLIRSI